MSNTHRSTRPKGYLEVVDYRSSDPNQWCPRPEALELIGQVQNVIANSTYQVSVRFLFYRLVGLHGYPKTELAYKNLAELLVKARRAQLIPFSDIADSDPMLGMGATGFTGRASFLRMKRSANGYDLDPQIGQPYYIELWSEDAGSVPMLAGMTSRYPVDIYSTGGFSSVTVTHAIAKRVMGRELPTIFLHIGDFDPSGESIFKSMSQDVGSFIAHETGCYFDEETGETEMNDGGPDFRPIRVALTREQANRWNLETAPPKRSDSRSRNWVGETVQVQAMSEDQMRTVVTEAILDHYDTDQAEWLARKSRYQQKQIAPLLRDAVDRVIEDLPEDIVPDRYEDALDEGFDVDSFDEDNE